MEVKYVAFDSFGVKSSCVFVETKDVRVCIDPGIAGETGSFPLPRYEKLALKMKYKGRIKKACKDADIIIITHYHYDHHIPQSELYRGKHLLIKDPLNNINASQMKRASYFLKIVKPKKIEVADNKKFKFGSTIIEFSPPLWHGVEGTNLGKVIMVSIKDNDSKLLHSSDIDGPYINSYAKLIAKQDPSLLILDGFPSYLLGFLASFENLKKVIENTLYIITHTESKVILDHHLLRDYRYREIYYEVYKKAKELGRKVHTAAEELGEKAKVIEGYERFGPTRWKEWQNFTFDYLHRLIEHAKKVKSKDMR